MLSCATSRPDKLTSDFTSLLAFVRFTLVEFPTLCVMSMGVVFQVVARLGSDFFHTTQRAPEPETIKIQVLVYSSYYRSSWIIERIEIFWEILGKFDFKRALGATLTLEILEGRYRTIPFFYQGQLTRNWGIFPSFDLGAIGQLGQLPLFFSFFCVAFFHFAQFIFGV